MRIICAAAIHSIISMYGYAASAQTISDATFSGDTFREAYNQNMNVSGYSVVGLALGSNAGLHSIKETFINRNAMTTEKNDLCLRIDSRDGLFWAENPYHVSDITGSDIVRLTPLTKQFRVKLNNRKEGDILGFARLPRGGERKRCELRSSEDIFIPLQATPDLDTNRLSIRVNSFDRLTQVRLVSPDGVKIDGTCESLGETALLYDKICQVELPDSYSKGVYTLSVTFKVPPFETETTELSVALPGRAK